MSKGRWKSLSNVNPKASLTRYFPRKCEPRAVRHRALREAQPLTIASGFEH